MFNFNESSFSSSTSYSKENSLDCIADAALMQQHHHQQQLEQENRQQIQLQQESYAKKFKKSKRFGGSGGASVEESAGRLGLGLSPEANGADVAGAGEEVLSQEVLSNNSNATGGRYPRQTPLQVDTDDVDATAEILASFPIDVSHTIACTNNFYML